MVILKLLALWLALLVGGILGGMLFPVTIPGEGDGPFTAGQAFLLVNFLHACVLTALGVGARWRGPALGATLAVTYLFAQSLLLLVEALWFNDYLGAPVGALVRVAGHACLQAALVGLTAAVLWRGDPAKTGTRPAATNPRRLPLAAAVYVAIYVAAGALIALSSPVLRDYYGVGADRGSDIAFLPLLILQGLRGLVWGALALLLAMALRGSALRRGLLAGVTFGVLATASLLYPTAFMPWSVRWVHIVEVMVSNTLFGWAAVAIFSADRLRVPRRRPSIA